jgi:hypothetical protein
MPQKIDNDDDKPVQRPVNLNAPLARKKQIPGQRVRVYNKLRAAIQMSDCILGPEEEGEVLARDADDPRISQHLLRLA